MRRVLGWATPTYALAAICLLALTLAGCGAPATGQWQTLRIGAGAHVLTLAADPFSAGRVYAGADNGVVYITNADQSGKPIASQGIPSGARVSALYPDPQHAGTLYAGTSQSLYRSQDYGQHWALYGAGLPSEAITALGGDTGSGVMLLAAHGTGVFASHDYGASWAYANRGLPAATINALLCVSASACFAAVDTTTAFGSVGVYATTDGGATWAADATGLPTAAGLPGGEVFALAELPTHSLAPSGPTLFAATIRGVYSSVDGGASWQTANNGLPAGSAQALDASTVAPGALYAGVGVSAYMSTDGGRRWSALATGLATVGATTVTGVVGVRGPRTGGVVFAAAGQFARTPPVPGSSNLIPTIVATLILLALLPLIIYRINVAIRQRARSRRLPSAVGVGDGPAAQPVRVSRSAAARAPTARGGRAKPTFAAEGDAAQPTIAGRAQTTPTTPDQPIMPPTNARPASTAKAQHNGHSHTQSPESGAD
ncbi:MAG TPA: hypothetical protein VMV29_08320 [Ktedonobacterales bacterium]|nr:hypothetical protein [Ktedonobacterales bacterium]